MTSHSDEMDTRIDDKEGEKEKKDSASLQEGMRRLSVSPPRHRTESPSMWRTSTPPPPAFPIRPRVETPTPQVQSGMPRTLSSPSLMDSSPKTRSPASMSAARKANELTPITRNTTSSFVDDGHTVVSPDDGMEDLHGEHLAMPTASFAEACLKRRASPSGPAPSLPPLPTMSERAKSMGNMLQQQQQEEDDDDYVPIDFPSERKYCHYSFTSQQQFTEQANTKSRLQRALLYDARRPGGLVPYQPPREDGNVGSFSDSVLGGIFQESIPLEDRQYSIPSIHLAHHLNGSTTSYTDEEDDLQRTFDDEASLSSRGSSLYLPGEDVEDSSSGETGGMAKLRVNVSAAKMAFRAPQQEEETPKIAFRALTDSHDSDNDADEEEEAPQKRMKKRTKRKERQAMDWLRSVECNNEAISEAASSKFLTSKAQVPSNRRRSYQRNTSSPLEEQYSGAFPPPSDTFPPSTNTH